MKAVVLRKPRDLHLMDVPEPVMGPGQAMVRVTHCGICGSDVRYLHGDNPWAKQTLGEKHENPPNIILGHEIAGVVEQVADEQRADLIGKRVALLAYSTCGQCYYCSSGNEHLCPSTQHIGHGAGWGSSEFYYGGMAERVPVPIDWLVPLPDGVSNEAGCILDPMGVAVHGLRVARLSQGDTVLIIGGGPVGALAAALAKTWGAGKCVLSDVSPGVLAVARRMGADIVVDSRTGNLAEEVREATAGQGVRVILDTIGLDLSTHLPMLARGGRYVTMTVTDEIQQFRTLALAGERSIASSCNSHYQDVYDAMALIEQGRVPAESIVTHRYSLDDALEAFRIAEDKVTTGAVKVMLVMS